MNSSLIFVIGASLALATGLRAQDLNADSYLNRSIAAGALGVAASDSAIDRQVPQPRPKATGEGFKEGRFYAGPRIIAGGYGATAIGFQVEKGIMQKQDWSNGRIGVSGSIDMFSYSDAYFATRWSYRVIPIAGFVNYHVTLKNPKIDPFIGAGLGYYIVSASYDGPGNPGYTARSSAMDFGVQLGGRYFFKPNMAVQAQTGLGFGAMALGLSWTM
jgi:hypothetical protein